MAEPGNWAVFTFNEFGAKTIDVFARNAVVFAAMPEVSLLVEVEGVPVVFDREADSVKHFRAWDRKGHRFVVRANNEGIPFVLAVFVAVFLFIIRIVHSPYGQVLKAIRENEQRLNLRCEPKLAAGIAASTAPVATTSSTAR